jgi:hypothetical protein
VAERKVRTIVAIGGNGTFAGIHALSKLVHAQVLSFLPSFVHDCILFFPVCVEDGTGADIRTAFFAVLFCACHH